MAEVSEIFTLWPVKGYRLKKMKIHFTTKESNGRHDPEFAYCQRKNSIAFTRNWEKVTCGFCLAKREKERLEQERQYKEQQLQKAIKRHTKEVEKQAKREMIHEWSHKLILFPEEGESDLDYEIRLNRAIKDYKEKKWRKEREAYLADESQGFLLLEKSFNYSDFERYELGWFLKFELGKTKEIHETGQMQFEVWESDDYCKYSMEVKEYLRFLKTLKTEVEKEIEELESEK